MHNFNTKDTRILVVGDLMLDHYIYGDCNRISPEAPVPVVEAKHESYTLGGAGNVLKNLNALNVKANIVSVTGADDAANIVIDQLVQARTSADNIIKDAQRCTTVKSRVLVSNHQLIRLDREVTDPIDDEIAKQLISIIEKDIENYDMVLLSDYNKGIFSDFLLKKIFEICRNYGITTVVDPKGADFSKYKGANVIKPNKKEAIVASGILIKDTDSLKKACEVLKDITGCDDIVITMSDEGIASFTNNQLTIIPTKAIDVSDVTGAGDTVLASLGFALACGSTLYEACDFANHAAAVVVSKVGSATATLDEINQKYSV
jgi:rfaE bifunctional protein kinase chain/domain